MGINVNQNNVVKHITPSKINTDESLNYKVNLDQKPDTFEKQKNEDDIIQNPDDVYVNQDEQMLGASPHKICAKMKLPRKIPPKVEGYLDDAWKWTKRAWSAAELYDTVDGYKDRLTQEPND